MKKMLLATALTSCTGCAQQTFTVQNKPAAVAPKETITHHFFVFTNWAERESVDAAKICGGAENVVKTETQQTFVNGLRRFYYFNLYSAGGACVLLTIITWVPIDMGNSICTAHLSFLGSFQLFL